MYDDLDGDLEEFSSTRRALEKRDRKEEGKAGREGRVRFVWIAFEEESTFDERGGTYVS